MIREKILSSIRSITPFDKTEAQDIQFAIDWINSGAELFRIQKPHIPKIHLVSYFVVISAPDKKVLLVHHKAANLWLPAGGHVEPGEHPLNTVKRECLEELGFKPDFFLRKPFFLSISHLNEAGLLHQDVPLWYVIHRNPKDPINFCHNEFNSIKWFDFKTLPPAFQTDPNMERFCTKLFSFINRESV